MRCKRPALWSEDHALLSRRDVLRTMGLAGAALATGAKGRSQPENLETTKTCWEDDAQFRRTIAVNPTAFQGG